ncbi:NUDIX domain-containing protein [Erythrobacter sp. Alg231-14]|uniref:NUDIX domain-containing protein n=1 Tax=Erythrobacter sp. Alg231-14 TaxID=1922225 RepID=UPI000D555107
MTASISDILLDWYANHARELPWRNPPGKAVPNDAAWPYRVWLSEVMLQQTTVAAVKPYFAKFTATWPTVFDLAAEDEGAVMAAWAGLGYYSRARNLVKCAAQVAELGGFPETEEELRKLPGLGAYAAASITAIAFGKRAVVIDANVERVVSRLFAIEEPLPASRKAIRAHADAITPHAIGTDQSSDFAPGNFAQAMMDLGAQICTNKAPRCLLCPLANHCEGRKLGEPERLPIKPPKKAKPERLGTAFWIERGGEGGREVWIATRPAQGMFGGMRGLPDDGWTAREDGSGQQPISGQGKDLGAVRHTFTHAHLTLKVVRIKSTTQPDGDGEWWPVERIGQAGLPTLFAKAARLIEAQDDDAS